MLFDRHYQISPFDERLAPIKFGYLMKDILMRFRNKVNGTLEPDYKLAVYSGHDSSIFGLLGMLNIFLVFLLNSIVHTSYDFFFIISELVPLTHLV